MWNLHLHLSQSQSECCGLSRRRCHWSPPDCHFWWHICTDHCHLVSLCQSGNHQQNRSEQEWEGEVIIILLITSKQIYILEVLCTRTVILVAVEIPIVHMIFVLYFCTLFFIILITYTIFFMTCLFICITHLFIILLVPHNCFNCILYIVLYFFKLYLFGLFVWNKHYMYWSDESWDCPIVGRIHLK